LFCGRFDHSKRAPSGWYLAEPITTVITDALPRATEGSATRASSFPPTLINVQHPDLLVPESRPVDQRCRLRITVVA
jgi:hypothetical protein